MQKKIIELMILYLQQREKLEQIERAIILNTLRLHNIQIEKNKGDKKNDS